MAEEIRRKGLGRGLAALMSDIEENITLPQSLPDQSNVSGQANIIAIEKIKANPNQPRKLFLAEQLSELAESIKTYGVLQPILVSRADENGCHVIIAGERRWRAAMQVGLITVPIIIKNLNDSEAMEIALVENIQRSDLSAIEEARGYSQLIEIYGHRQDDIAKLVGKSRSHITNSLRLLSLEQEILTMVENGSISAGHARCLVGVEGGVAIAYKIIAGGLNVRQLEAIVRDKKNQLEPQLETISSNKKKQPEIAIVAKQGQLESIYADRENNQQLEIDTNYNKDDDTILLENDLASAVGLLIDINHRKDGSGELKVTYHNLRELDRLCRRLCGPDN